jgi:hypothetical protein
MVMALKTEYGCAAGRTYTRDKKIAIIHQQFGHIFGDTKEITEC